MKTYRMGHHGLDETKNVVRLADDDREAIAKAWKIENRRVAQTDVGDRRVSTVFLNLDHGSVGAPLFFETMIFTGESNLEDYCELYATWAEAVAGHERAVAKITEAG